MREYVVISRCADCLVWQRRAEHRVTVVQAIAVALAAALVALLPVPPVARTLSFVVLGAAALLAGLALGGAWVERSFLHPQGRRSRAERLLHPRVRALTESGWTPFDVPRSVPGDTGTVLATANYLHTTTGDLGPLLAACAKARSLAPAEAALPIGDVSAGAA